MTIKANVRRLRATIQRVEQQPYDFTRAPRAPRIAGSTDVGYCQLGSSIAAATGTWPNLTPGSQSSVTVYRPVNGSPVALPNPLTIKNYHAVPFVAAKTTAVAIRGDGTADIIDQDC